MDSTRLHEQFSFKMQCMGTERHKRFLKPIKALSYYITFNTVLDSKMHELNVVKRNADVRKHIF